MGLVGVCGSRREAWEEARETYIPGAKRQRETWFPHAFSHVVLRSERILPQYECGGGGSPIHINSILLERQKKKGGGGQNPDKE